MKHVAIIGSTGSIGTQTLEIARWNQDIKICALSAGRNIDLLEKQAREFRPEIVGLWDEKLADELKDRLKDMESHGVSGIAEYKTSDILVTAIVGMIGIRPTVAAIKAGKDIALANKETLVTAGHIIMPLAKEKGVSILPVDSEHSAIFQSLQGNTHDSIEKILLTASGGPFRGKSREFLKHVKLEDALKHPNWSMGRKITIDSATMVNKGLEVIEAKWLFDVAPENIQVVIQPQSIIHSMVEYKDGAVIAQLGTPDMKLPIQYALFYPERRYMPGDRLDFTKLSSIVIETPDMNTFLGPTVFNAANEYAVKQFLDRKIDFLDIYDIIRASMDHHKLIENPDIDEILATEQEVYEFIESGC